MNPSSYLYEIVTKERKGQSEKEWLGHMEFCAMKIYVNIDQKFSTMNIIYEWISL